MSFFKEMVEKRTSKEQLPIIAAVGQPGLLEKERTKLSEQAVFVDDLIELDFAALKLTGVPAMILINKEGEVEGYWKGYLDEDKQAKTWKEIGETAI